MVIIEIENPKPIDKSLDFIWEMKSFVCVELELNFMSHSVCGVEIHIFSLNHQAYNSSQRLDNSIQFYYTTGGIAFIYNKQSLPSRYSKKFLSTINHKIYNNTTEKSYGSCVLIVCVSIVHIREWNGRTINNTGKRKNNFYDFWTMRRNPWYCLKFFFY